MKVIMLWLMAAAGWGQDTLTLTAGVPGGVRPDSISISATNRNGASRACYWVIAVYPIGKVNATGPNCIDKLSASSTITVSWGGMQGATSYDVLRYDAGTVLPGSGSLLVGNTGATSLNTTLAGALTAYTVQSAPNPALATIKLNNRDYSTPKLDVGMPLAGSGLPSTTNVLVGDGTGGVQASGISKSGSNYTFPGSVGMGTTVLAPGDSSTTGYSITGPSAAAPAYKSFPALKILKGTNGQSVLDLHQTNNYGWLQRWYQDSDAALDRPTTYINSDGAFYSRAWMIISGSTSGQGWSYQILDPSADNPMFGVWSDVTGPAIQTRPGPNPGYNYSALDGSANHVFTVESNGALRFGAGTLANMDTSLFRSAAGVLRVGLGAATNAEGTLEVDTLRIGNAGYNVAWQSSGTLLHTRSDFHLKWASDQDANAGKDTGIARAAAGVLKVSNGSTGLGKIALVQATPAAATDACTAGSIWTDADYIYVCTASGAIKRAAISTW